jgi:hypothetical protein
MGWWLTGLRYSIVSRRNQDRIGGAVTIDNTANKSSTNIYRDLWIVKPDHPETERGGLSSPETDYHQAQIGLPIDVSRCTPTQDLHRPSAVISDVLH